MKGLPNASSRPSSGSLVCPTGTESQVVRKGGGLNLPMRVVLLAPLTTVLIASLGLITSLNTRNAEIYAQQAANELTERTSHEVEIYLNGFMRQPVQAVESMADAVESGMVRPNDQEGMARFMQQLRTNFPDVPYISYAFLDHAFVGVGKSGNNEQLPDVLEARPAGETHYLNQYSLLPDGSRGKLQSRDSFSSFLEEDWFKTPLKASGVVWTKIYNWDDVPEVMAISIGKPIHRGGQAIGIAGSDVLLVSLSRYLQSLHLSPRSVITISEDNGLLVATSAQRFPFDIRNGRGVRRPALMDPNPVIRGSAALLMRRFGSFETIPAARTLRMDLQREPYLIRVAPWRDPHGLHWIITLAVPESDFTGFVSRQRRDTLLLSLAAISLAGLLGWALVRALIRPIEAVAAASSQLAAEGRAPALRPGLLSEVNRLSQAFSSTAEQLLGLLRQLQERQASAEEDVARRTAELRQTNSRLEEEGAMAARIQQELLVPSDQLDALTPDLRVAAQMVASRSVGGDLYDVIGLRDDLLLFCVGDVSGKGMPAALLMSTCLSQLRSYAEALDSPSAIMRRINLRLAENNDDCAFTTLVIGVINHRSGEMRYCNAGHNPMLLHRSGLPTEVLRTVHGPALGVRAGVVYGEGRLFLGPGDLLLAYSDGASEMFSRDAERFGLVRLIASLERWSDQRGGHPRGLVHALVADLRTFAAGEAAHDDVTLLAMRRVGVEAAARGAQ
jgi:serine phosphatase RsbU (regulator of sigma subunit)